jgi:coenzyme Q-binding protein COQ10
MINIVQSHVTNYSIEQVYAVITDITAYPEFMNFCHSVVIVEQDKHTVIADVICGLSRFRACYRSLIQLEPPYDGIAKIAVRGVDGPFQSLHVLWKITQQQQGSIIHFSIDIDLSGASKFLFQPFINSMSIKVIQLFENRIEKLYKTNSIV